MRVVNVEPRDIYITLELSLVEAEKILDAVDSSKIEITKETPPETKQAIEFFTNVFFKYLNELVESLKK